MEIADNNQDAKNCPHLKSAPAASDAFLAQTSFGLRPIGGTGTTIPLFRSGELCHIEEDEARFIQRLGIRTIYDLRNAYEAAHFPEPVIVNVKSIAYTPTDFGHDKSQGTRLVAGVIGEYGAPGERMCKIYRKFAKNSALLGRTLRTIAIEGVPALVHCANGKDRTGVLCATLLRIAGYSQEEIYDDYLRTNEFNREKNACDLESYGVGMTSSELEILRSFFDARPEYLSSYFEAIDEYYGSFQTFVAEQLHLGFRERGILKYMMSR